MSIESVNLLKERVLRAAIECVAEFESRESVMHTKGSRALVHAVKALQEATWQIDVAPAIIRELLLLVELQPELTSILATQIREGRHEGVLRAKAFLGERKVDDDTTPIPKPRRGILRRANR